VRNWIIIFNLFFFKHSSCLLKLFYCPVLWTDILCYWRLCAWIMYVELPWWRSDNIDHPHGATDLVESGENIWE
jgi:hypothetical protein